MIKTWIGASALALVAGMAAAQTEVRVMWYSDGVEGEVIADLLARFEADHPEIDIVLDNVAYQVIQEQLPIQLASGEGPDIARVTNLIAQADHWLDKPAPCPQVSYGTAGLSVRQAVGTSDPEGVVRLILPRTALQ